MAILLTGSSGCLGSGLLPRLLEIDEVISLSLQKLGLSHPNLREAECDICNYDYSVLRWEQITSVVHLASAGVNSSHRNWHSCLSVNILGTQRLLDAIEKHGRKDVSILVARTYYEDAISSAPDLASDPYFGSKFVTSELVRAWSKRTRIPIKFARIFHVYGPGCENVLSYAARCLKDRQQAVFSSGKGLNDWIYIDDAVEGILAVFRGKSGDWDVGSGELIDLKSVLVKMAVLNGSAAYQVFDASKDRPAVEMRAEKFPVDWSASTSLEDGLRGLLA